ncbi:MAG: InlB B-repeat-containing protein, partial [Erysipelotrichaceae bacterium]|nr:InlB B-repeat-containing protein [Erysipelotrichaceae bacterium]
MEKFFKKTLTVLASVLLLVNTLPVHLNADEEVPTDVVEEAVAEVTEAPAEEQPAPADPEPEEEVHSARDDQPAIKTGVSEPMEETEAPAEEAAPEETMPEAPVLEEEAAEAAEDSPVEDEVSSEDEPDPVIYTVQFFVDGVEQEELAFEIEAGKVIGDLLPEAPEKEGYAFEKWVDQADAEIEIDKETVVDDDLKVDAVYAELAEEDPVDPDEPVVTPEDPDEPVEEEIVYAPNTYEGNAFVGNQSVFVTVSDETGVLPEGTTMTVEPVVLSQDVIGQINDSVEGQVANVLAVDITFWYKGEKIEPNGSVNVQMRAYGLDQKAEQQVVHIDDDNNVEVLDNADIAKTSSKTTAEFDSDSFSIYVIVTTGEDARLHVIFKQADGTEVEEMINARQITHIEQYIYDPGTGTLPEGAIFAGWTTEENYTSETTAKTIAQVREDVKAKLNEGVTDGQKVYYYAMVFVPYTVTYIDERGIMVKTDQKLVKA